MQLSTHLSFDGNCAEAMEFYAKVFEGNVQTSMTWGDSPMADQVDATYKDKIMHCDVRVGETHLLGADAPPGRFRKAEGMMVSIDVPGPEKTQQVFDALAAGGTIRMPFAPTFWSKGFGMCTDRFGIPWTVNCADIVR